MPGLLKKREMQGCEEGRRVCHAGDSKPQSIVSWRRCKMISIQGVLVPVDFSKESILAAKFGASLAEEYNSKLYLLHVLEPLHSSVRAEISDFDLFQQRMIDQAKEDLEKVVPAAVKQRLEVEEVLEIGQPQYVIVEKAKELGVDVIVIATHGRTGLAHVLLGSVAEKVIRHAPCPVFVIRNPKDKYVYGWE
jgi:nucleotide-binding universal stress UspA family protein